jgi:hypothetical protein
MAAGAAGERVGAGSGASGRPGLLGLRLATRLEGCEAGIHIVRFHALIVRVQPERPL